jgi:hypothetical protein
MGVESSTIGCGCWHVEHALDGHSLEYLESDNAETGGAGSGPENGIDNGRVFPCILEGRSPDTTEDWHDGLLWRCVSFINRIAFFRCNNLQRSLSGWDIQPQESKSIRSMSDGHRNQVMNLICVWGPKERKKLMIGWASTEGEWSPRTELSCKPGRKSARTRRRALLLCPRRAREWRNVFIIDEDHLWVVCPSVRWLRTLIACWGSICRSRHQPKYLVCTCAYRRYCREFARIITFVAFSLAPASSKQRILCIMQLETRADSCAGGWCFCLAVDTSWHGTLRGRGCAIDRRFGTKLGWPSWPDQYCRHSFPFHLGNQHW